MPQNGGVRILKRQLVCKQFVGGDSEVVGRGVPDDGDRVEGDGGGGEAVGDREGIVDRIGDGGE
jgi:hypothetical protein